MSTASPKVPTPNAGANQGAAEVGSRISLRRAPLAVSQITPDHESAEESRNRPASRHEKPDPELTKTNGKTYQTLQGHGTRNRPDQPPGWIIFRSSELHVDHGRLIS